MQKDSSYCLSDIIWSAVGTLISSKPDLETQNMNKKSIQAELRTRSYSKSEIAKALQKQVLIVPQLIITHEDTGGRSQLVRGDVSDIRKVLTQAGFETEVILDKGLRRRVLVRKDADIVLPLVLFGANIPLSVATSYIASWLFARFKGQQVNIKYEHARFGPDGKITDYIKIEGKPKEVAEILKSGRFQSTVDTKDNQLNRE